MKKIFTLLIMLAIVAVTSTTSAAERLIEASGDYIMDARLDETPASATARAREEAKRAAVEKAGTYVESYSKAINMELDTDEIRTVAARLLKVQSESPPKIEVVGDDKNLLKFVVTITALVDDIGETDLKALMQDKKTLEELTRKNRELQEKYDELNRQMKQYQRDFDSADDARKVEIKKEVARNSEKFSAVDELARGNDFSARGNYSQALTAYDTAIKLDSSLAEAYNNRGIVKYELGQYSAAIDDYSRAIQLKSGYADAFNNRGNAYAALEQFTDSERDLKAALKLNDKSAIMHNNLGSVYFSLKKFAEAVDEYTRAVQLNPKYADAWYNRAVAYYAQGNLVQSLLDIKQAHNLNSNDATIIEFYEKISRLNG